MPFFDDKDRTYLLNCKVEFTNYLSLQWKVLFLCFFNRICEVNDAYEAVYL